MMTQQVTDQIDTATEDQLRRAIAFARKPCPDPGYHHVHGSSVEGEHCMDCDGSGAVYALKDVRQVCPCCMGYRSLYWDREGKDYRFVPSVVFVICKACHVCHGYGEVPAEGLETWQDGALSLPELDHIVIYPEFYRDTRRLRLVFHSATMVTADGHTVEEALLRALAQVLETQGANLALEEA